MDRNTPNSPPVTTTRWFYEARWKVLLLLFLARTSLGFQFQSLGSVSPRLIEDLSLNYTQIGTLIGLFTVAGIFLSIPVGMALRYSTEKTLAALGLLLLAIGGFTAYVAAYSELSTYHLIAFGRFICGTGFVLSTVYLTKMITDWFAGKELATALGILVISWPMGIATAQVTHPLIAAQFGWHIAFLVSSIYCLAGCLLIAFFYHSPPPTGTSVAPTSNKLGKRHFILTLIAATAWASFNAGYIVYLSFAQPMLIHLGMTEYKAAALVSLPSWVMIIASIVAGQLADRTGKNDLILYTGMFAACIAMLLLTVSGYSLVAVLVFGFIGAAPVGVIMALTAEAMPPQSRAFGMGVFFSIYFIVVSVAPVTAGWLFDVTSSPVAPMLLASLFFVLVAVTNLLFRATQRQLPH